MATVDTFTCFCWGFVDYFCVVLKTLKKKGGDVVLSVISVAAAH